MKKVKLIKGKQVNLSKVKGGNDTLPELSLAQKMFTSNSGKK